MEEINIHPLTKFEQVLNFDFSTIMLFRCTKKRFANSFREGKLFFNKPKNWIREEIDGNKGRGDILEGTFLYTNSNDKSDFIESLKKDESIEHFDNMDYTYFRKKSINDINCLCFYGLHDNSFKEKIVDDKGKAHYYAKVGKEYFLDFSDSVTKELYESMDDLEKPVVVFINNPNELFKRIRNFFKNFDILDKDIIISPIQYVNKRKVSIAALEYPKELLLKDDYYKNQSEVRIIINSNDEKLLEYLNQNQNIINIGNIEDITELYDHYFEDLVMERVKKNEVIFNLSKPIIKSFDDMELAEILIRLSEVENNKLGQQLKPEEKEQIIGTIKDTLKKKYNIDVEIEKNNVNINGASDEIFEYLENLNEPNKNIKLFENKIVDLIEKKEYLKAIAEIENNNSNNEISNVGKYYKGKIFELNKEYENAIREYTDCINNEIKVEDSISSRSICYRELNNYDLAIDDMELLQEKIGYNCTIYSNKGINLIHLDRLPEAIIEFDKSIQLEEINPVAYYNRSVAFFRMQNFKQAKEDMKKSLKYNPNNDFYKMQYEMFYKDK